MREEISEWEVDSIKPVSNQFKTTFYPPAIMECRLCRTTSGFNSPYLNKTNRWRDARRSNGSPVVYPVRKVIFLDVGNQFGGVPFTPHGDSGDT